jgi:hypothetical protein
VPGRSARATVLEKARRQTWRQEAVKKSAKCTRQTWGRTRNSPIVEKVPAPYIHETSSCSPPGSPRPSALEPAGLCCHPITSTLSLLEGESTCEHHRSTSDAGYCDLCDAWIRNPAGQSGWIEFIAGIFKAWMVKDVFRIHPKLQFA